MMDLTYFAQYGQITRPGPYAYMYEGLPSDVPLLIEVVQGLMVHVFWADRYGLNLSEERQAEVQLRSMERRLARTLALAKDHRQLPRLLGDARIHATVEGDPCPSALRIRRVFPAESF
jgi:hypothetical protein